MIRVQREDFDIGAELARFGAGNARIGGVSVFVGLVRDLTDAAEGGRTKPGGAGRQDQNPGADVTPPGVPSHDAAGSSNFGACAPGGVMTLEHYPGMTENEIAGIEKEARARWPLEDVLVIHRYGRLEPGDRIVLVATASAHREAAFASCHFLIDWLKTKAPFWKREETPAGGQWVAARGADDAAAERWTQDPKTRP